MNHRISLVKALPHAIYTGIALMCFMLSAQAGDLSVAGNSINVFNSASPLGAKAISANGLVDDVTGVPTAAGGLDFPTFTFAFEKSTSFTDGTYTFRGGFIIDQDSSGRRLEMSIPSISMTISGGTLTGSVPASQVVTVLGRSNDSSLQAISSISNNLASFSGASLSFNSTNQLNKIKDEGGILADIITSIDTAAHYHYSVFLKQTGGPENVRFGQNATTSLTPFPCNDGSAFVLNSASLASSYSGAYALQGRVSFAGASGVQEAPPSAYSSTCATFITGGGGGGGGTPEPTPQAAADAVVNSTGTSTTDLFATITSSGFSAATLTSFKSLVTSSTSTATSVAAGMKAGTVLPSTGITLLASFVKQMNILYLAANSKQVVERSTRIALLGNIGKLIGGLKGLTLAPEQIAEITASVKSIVIDAEALFAALKIQFGLLSVDPLVSYDAITLDTAIVEISELVAGLKDIINNAIEIPGYQIDAATFIALQEVSQTALEILLKPVGTRLGVSVNYSSPVAARNLLAANSGMLDLILNTSGINIGESTSVSATALQSSLVAAGLSAAFATSLSENLTLYTKADALSVNNTTGLKTVSSLLQTALNASTLTVNATTGVIDYTIAGSNYSAFLQSVMPAASALPTGKHTLPDGGQLIVTDNMAFILVPAISDVTGFAAAINTVGSGGFSTALKANGSIVLKEIVSNVKFVAAISGEPTSALTGTGSTSFTAPTGNPASTSHSFTVKYADGKSQTIVPVAADNTFFDSVGSAGFIATTDRISGVIQIGSFRFRPAYFQTPLTSSDSVYLNSNRDSSGVAYRPINANGDGITDYQVFTASGVQIFYGL